MPHLFHSLVICELTYYVAKPIQWLANPLLSIILPAADSAFLVQDYLVFRQMEPDERLQWALKCDGFFGW